MSLILVAVVAFSTAIAHMACIPIGAQCYAVQMAPQILIESANKGTYLAPVATILVSSIFILFGLYALSGAGMIRKLPLLTFGSYSIAVLCIVRGVLPLQLWLRYSERVDLNELLYGMGWLVTGLLLLFGYYSAHKAAHSKLHD